MSKACASLLISRVFLIKQIPIEKMKSSKFVLKFSWRVHQQFALCLYWCSYVFKKMRIHKMKLRSSITPQERERVRLEELREMEEQLNAPLLEFPGKINYIMEFVDCVIMCNQLISSAITSDRPYIMGLSVEWPVISPRRGFGKFCFLQLCYTPVACYVIKVDNIKKLGRALNELLIHPNMVLAGINIKSTIRKLAKEFPHFEDDIIIENCVDCGVLANKVLPIRQRWTLEKLVAYMYKLKFDKKRKHKMSKWYGSPLTIDYLRCGAAEAFASLALYFDLKVKLTEQPYPELP